MDFDMFNIPVINLNYYDALGLKEEDDPTVEEIQAAYRHLALQWHPERNKDLGKRETASLKFVEINEAYKFLMDKKQREAKQAAKAAKSKRKDERALSPRALSPRAGVTSPTRTSSPGRSRAVSQPPPPMPDIMISNSSGPSVNGSVADTESTRLTSVSGASSSTSRTSRSTVTSPTHLSTSLPTHSYYSQPRSAVSAPRTPHSRGPSPSARSRSPYTHSRGDSPGGRTPTRLHHEDQTRASAVRSPPAIFTFEEDHRGRHRERERYDKRPMSDMTSELGSEASSFSNGYTSSVVSSSSVATNIPDDWMFPLYLTLEDLYTCKSHRFKINRHLLNGTSKEVFVDVSVQPNWRDGTQIRCKGLGNEREGLPPQPYSLPVKEKLHPRFLRDPVGYDVYARLEISVVVALGGAVGTEEALQIKGVDGRGIVVEVPPPVVRHGSMTRIKGAGMPKYKSKDGSVPLRGDLLLEWCVLPPEKPLSEEALAELRKALGDDWLRDEEE
ncbi:DnaJ domain protein [Ceratobasidium sp. AG-Ba]|nr:DnaJ domain protein [Ceratobasidium sp. AG-Ba]